MQTFLTYVNKPQCGIIRGYAIVFIHTAYKQLYVISFFSLIALLFYPKWHYYFLQVIILPNNTLCVIGTMTIWGYLLWIHVLATYLIYYHIYFLYTCLLQLQYDRWNYHCCTIICYNIHSRRVGSNTNRVCSTIKFITISVLFVFK